MLLRIARASPALARLRPLLQPAQRPAMAVAAGVAVNLFVVKGGVVSVPTDRAVVGMHATENVLSFAKVARNLRGRARNSK